jgi:sortase A
VSEYGWPAPTEEELRAANGTRRYDLPPGAVMGLTIKAMGLQGVPVIDSDSQWAFDSGVVHEPETSLPWSDAPQRNVYLAAHRLGYRGSWSRLVFYNLDKLAEGDRVVLEDRDGKAYEYRVNETFVVAPTDVWVMGQVEGKRHAYAPDLHAHPQLR